MKRLEWKFLSQEERYGKKANVLRETAHEAFLYESVTSHNSVSTPLAFSKTVTYIALMLQIFNQ